LSPETEKIRKGGFRPPQKARAYYAFYPDFSIFIISFTFEPQILSARYRLRRYAARSPVLSAAPIRAGIASGTCRALARRMRSIAAPDVKTFRGTSLASRMRSIGTRSAARIANGDSDAKTKQTI
jgi:hypothetical protein